MSFKVVIVDVMIVYGTLHKQTHTVTSCVAVVVYKCEAMAANCGECLTQSRDYQCGWCDAHQQCSIAKNCDVSNSWLDDSTVCPDPGITSVRLTLFVW